MSGSVSVPGPNGSSITQTFSNNFNNALAKSIADALANAASQGDLFIQTVTGSVSAPVNNSGKIGELVVIPGSTGDVTVPSGANYSFVVDNSAGPDTIHGSTSLSVMGGDGIHTIIDPAIITLSDNAIGNITLTNTGDTVAAGNGAATVNATADSEVVLGGAGALFANLSGPNATLVGGAGAVFATVSGSSSEVVGSTAFGTGGLVASVSGTSDTILAGSGSAAVTLSSSASKGLVAGTSAALSVLDSGTSDTIEAGTGFTSITASSGSFVAGGSGPLNFVGGTGPSTIVGASGRSTVFGNTGLTSVVAANGSNMTYVNTTPGGLFYAGGGGNETIDASLSKGVSTVYGGLDPAGHQLLIGGVGTNYLNAGEGSDTLLGGGGVNDFFFFSSFGGPTSSHVIGNFSAIDTVFLLNYGSDAASAALATATTAGGSTTITLADNTRITFTGVTTSAALSGHIFST
jgi:hypothetical protein